MRSNQLQAPSEMRRASALPARILVVVDDDNDDAQAAIVALQACLPDGVDVDAINRSRVDDPETVTDPTGIWRRQLDTLSRREHEVLQELVDGFPFTEAAERLFVSRHTFRTHMKNILAKLSVHSSLEAVSIGVRGGMRPRLESYQAS